jgi:hypothetical protein
MRYDGEVSSGSTLRQLGSTSGLWWCVWPLEFANHGISVTTVISAVGLVRAGMATQGASVHLHCLRACSVAWHFMLHTWRPTVSRGLDDLRVAAPL